MITVLDNAYLRKAQEIPAYNIKHQKILYLLLHEKKYYEKGDLLPLANNNLEELDKTLELLEKAGLIKTEGWLVKITDHNQLFGEEMEEKMRVNMRKLK
ncbi:MAG: phage replisome organizer N-terminal domain-containing protein [Candidatus Diapherotrites archaeon]|nr:phage replisome organizer N-terminal domain-containing protein [Candidatus Diapherotrites archaeon]